MSSETFNTYAALAGSRVADNSELQQACEVIDAMPCKDFLSLLTLASETRSRNVQSRHVVNGNNFHEPSSVNPRHLHETEGVIFDKLDEVEFVELSPLQPFGLNAVLANVNQKTVVSTLRRSEVSADAAASLFVTALKRFKSLDTESVTLGTHARITRAQKFDPVTKFLPHFKMFGQVTIGKQRATYGDAELRTFASHLKSEVGIIDELSRHRSFDLMESHISIGNTLFVADLLKRGMLEEIELRANTITPGYNPFEVAGLDIPEYIKLDSSDISQQLRDIGFSVGVKVVNKFKDQLETICPELMPRLSLHLGRIAGMGYYKHMCYKIEAENSSGLKLPLADGGTVDWAVKATNDRQLYTVTTGIGTELLAQYFHA